MKFYDDETYIEMCRKAGEIQAARKYEVGDFFDHNIGTIIFGSGFDNNESCRDTSAIWLPRLDQLIDMLDESVSKEYKTPYYKIWEFYEYAMVKTEPHGDWTTEQVMIQFVMYKKYRKRWDFEKKEWVMI